MFETLKDARRANFNEPTTENERRIAELADAWDRLDERRREVLTAVLETLAFADEIRERNEQDKSGNAPDPVFSGANYVS